MDNRGFSLENVSWSPQGRLVLGPLSLSLQEKGITALVGPNGGGKSSLLRLSAGLTKCEGRVLWGGIELSRAPVERSWITSFVGGQEAHDLPWTLGETLEMGEGADFDWKNTLVQELGLAGMEKHPFSKLSLGYQTLTHLARVMWRDTPVLLLDEPLAHLDWNHRLRVIRLLHAHAARGKIIVVALHEHFGYIRADWVAGLRQGKLVHFLPRKELVEKHLKDIWEPENQESLTALKNEWFES